MKKLSFLLAFALVGSTMAFGQGQQASPRDSVSGTVAGATITINYGSPSVKGRKIWGGLVPYDKVWRTGANQATTFETSKDVQIGGKTLHAGKYSLYTVPGQKEWKIIFNTQTGQWGIKMNGATTEDPAKDALVTTVRPMKSRSFNERMKFEVNDHGFVLLWENLAVPVEIH